MPLPPPPLLLLIIIIITVSLLHVIQTSSGVQIASYTIGTGGKAAGA
jgi:hypothetical protein